MTSRRRRSSRRFAAAPRMLPFALAATCALLVSVQAVLGWPGAAADAVLHDVVVNVVAVAASLVAALGARRDGPSARGWRLVAVALVLMAIGNAAWTIVYESATVSPADAICLGSNVALFAGIVALGRSWAGDPPRIFWLDGAAAVLAVLALVLAALLPAVTAGGAVSTAETLANLSYPVLDSALLMAVATLLALGGGRPPFGLLVVGAAVLVQFLADGLGVWWLRATDDVVVGRIIDAGWCWAWLLLATAAMLGAPRRRALRADGALIAAAPLIAVTICVGVLVTAPWVAHPAGAVVAATAGIAVATARALLTFRHLRVLTEARRLAQVDVLTGLPNRRQLMTRLSKRVDREGEAVLLLLDVDRFKDINDTLGHVTGDRLLERLAARLGSATAEQHDIARLGGDEFAVLLAPSATLADGRATAEHLRRALDAPIELDGMALRLEASIGIAELTGTWTAEDALRRADVAMYRAKATRTGVSVYDAADDAHSRERLTIAAALRRGLERDEIVVVVQPMVDVDGAFAAAEALVRWRHPERGLLSPAAFLPDVQHSALMIDITDCVLRAALRAREHWGPEHAHVPIAVNLSPQDLRDPRLPDRVRAALVDCGARPADLCLEISESAVAGDLRRAQDALAELRALGCQLALDDFGTGHSALAHLKDLDVDELKIDRGFTSGLPDDEWGAATITAAVALARARGLRIVAEGPETAAAVHCLAVLGVDLLQGYAIARPMNPEDVPGWNRDMRPRLLLPAPRPGDDAIAA